MLARELPLNGAQCHPCFGQSVPNARIPAIDVTTVLGVSLRRRKGSAVDDVHWNGVFQINAGFFACGQFCLEEPFGIASLFGQQRVGKVKRVGQPDAAVGIGPYLAPEQVLGGGVVQIDVVGVGEHELDQAHSALPLDWAAGASQTESCAR